MDVLFNSAHSIIVPCTIIVRERESACVGACVRVRVRVGVRACKTVKCTTLTRLVLGSILFFFVFIKDRHTINNSE